MPARTGRQTSVSGQRTSEPLLSQFMGTRSRFARSVNLIEDIRNPEAIATYYFGRKSIQLLEMFASTFKPELTDRAWFVAGPYGSGKSTFALFLSCLFAGRRHDSWLRPALDRLKALSPTLFKRLDREILDPRRPRIPVIVQGHRGDPSRALLTGLLAAARGQSGVGGWASRSFLNRLSRTLSGTAGRRVEPRSVLEFFEAALSEAKKRRKGGLLLLVDECGKFLEAAPYLPGGVDLMPFQDLAELGARTTDPQLHVVLFLHQSFDSYAVNIPHHQRQEWGKIQGRFREVDFTEDSDEVYDLVSAALADRRRSDEGFKKAIDKWSRGIAEEALEYPAFQIGARKSYWLDLFTKTYPLHPMTLFALPRLSARVAQNERTVFTFLSADEPLGLRGYLAATAWRPDRPPTVTLDYLYDYFLQAFRGDVSLGGVARRWVEVASALDRLGDRPEIESRILKATGILNLLSSSRLAPSSREVIRFALGVASDEEDAFEQGLKYLVERKLLVFRRYTNEYRVWQGSDFEFDQAVEGLRGELRQGTDVAAYLQEDVPPPTIVARRHSHRCGTLRFFAGQYVTMSRLKDLDTADWSDPSFDTVPPDGRILYVLPETPTEIKEALRIAKALSRKNVVLVVPKEPLPYIQTALDLMALHRLQTSATELRDDPVAQRELQERLVTCEESLRRLLAQVTEPVRRAAFWITARGKTNDVTTNEGAQRLISKICDRTYPFSPTVRNELINRTTPSSNIATARNRLVEKLLAQDGRENLGITGNPPELSILRAIFVRHGLYRCGDKGSWRLGRPTTRDEGVRECWKAVEQCIFESKAELRSVSHILEYLARPPFGARQGVSQLLLFAALLHHRDSVALYEDSTFIRDWSLDRVEMLFKRPDRFSIRYLSIAGSRQKLLEAIRKPLSAVEGQAPRGKKAGKDGFGETLQALYKWLHKLPQYSRSTISISRPAQEFRQALLSAKVPEKLLFEDLPSIFGIRPDSLTSGTGRTRGNDGGNTVSLLRGLEQAITEIDSAYERLLERLQSAVVTHLKLPANMSKARAHLLKLKEDLCPILSDSRAKVFLTRAGDERQGVREWTESVAAGVEGKPPAFWIDAQEEDFRNALVRIAQHVGDARSLATTLARAGKKSTWGTFERILVDGVEGQAFEDVIPVGEGLSRTAKRMLEKLRATLEEGQELDPEERKRIVVELLKGFVEQRP